jgi:hypothetical protein
VNVHAALLGKLSPQRGQPLRVRVGQSAQEHGVDDGEDGGVGPDSETEGEADHRGEPGPAAQAPNREAQVPPQSLHHGHAQHDLQSRCPDPRLNAMDVRRTHAQARLRARRVVTDEASR